MMVPKMRKLCDSYDPQTKRFCSLGAIHMDRKVRSPQRCVFDRIGTPEETERISKFLSYEDARPYYIVGRNLVDPPIVVWISYSGDVITWDKDITKASRHTFEEAEKMRRTIRDVTGADMIVKEQFEEP